MESHSLKGIRKEFKANGVFYTPPELAVFMRSFFPADVDEVYDPTCGNGSLLRVFGDGVRKYGQELDEAELDKARKSLKNFTGVAGDTLECPAFRERKFRYIIANPPFSVRWRPHADERFEGCPAMPPPSKGDYAFILHIVHALADGGLAVVMNFPGVLYRGNSEGAIRRWLVERNLIESVVAIPGKKFDDTAIATCVLVISKAKSGTDIKFVDLERNAERTVSFAEVEKNGFNLSVSAYIVVEKPREAADPLELERAANENFLKMLKRELDFSQDVYRIEGWGWGAFSSRYLDGARKVLDAYTEKRYSSEVR